MICVLDMQTRLTVKRAILGQFHHVSRKYLPLDLDEIAYRYNRRSVGAPLDGVLHLAVNP